MDWIVDLGNVIWAWFGVEDNQNRVSAIAAAGGVVLVVIGAVLGGVWFVLKQLFSPHKIPVSKTDEPPQVENQIPRFTVTEFVLARRELKAELEAELATAHADEKTQLSARIAELESQVANPEQGLEVEQKRIAELDARLERFGNDIGGDRIAEAHAALERGDYSIADELFAEIEVRRALEVQEAARAATGRGEIAMAEVRWADAAEHYTRAARLDPTYDTLLQAGHLLWRSGRHDDAIRNDEQLVGFAKQAFGVEHEKTAIALNNLAENYRATGRYEAAEPLYGEALEIDRNTLGTLHSNYAAHLNNLALLLEETGRYEEAEPLFRETLEIDRKMGGTEHPNYASHLNNLAELLRATGRFDDAEPLYREALEIDHKTIGTLHPDYAIRLNNLALLRKATGRYEEAESLYREAVGVMEAGLGVEHPNSKTVRENLQRFLAERGE